MTGPTDFSVLRKTQTGSGARPNGMVFFHGIKQPGSEANHSSSYSVEVKNEWN